MVGNCERKQILFFSNFQQVLNLLTLSRLAATLDFKPSFFFIIIAVPPFFGRATVNGSRGE